MLPLGLFKNNKNIKWFFFAFIFLFLLVLKFHNYDRVPSPGHAEELLYSWSGINLIETGIPMSWSTLDYPNENLMFDGIVGDPSGIYLPAKMYRPWLDEPPLYSLMSGGVAHLYGDNRNKVIPASHSRIPSVLASAITMFLIFWVAYKFYNFKIGLISMCFYGLTPIFVFGSRLSVPENIIALATIFLLLMSKTYLTKPKIYFPCLFGFITLLLGLMKPTGFFLAPLVIYLAYSKKKWKDIAIILGFVLLGVSLYIAYGHYYDWELFKHIVAIQGGRFAGWSGLPYILSSPAYDISMLFDGWYIFAFIFALFFSFKKNKNKYTKLISLFFFYWLLVAIFSGTEQDLLPWYRYPMFPFLAIFGALGLQWLYKKANFFSLALVIGLLLSSRFFLSNAFRPTTPTIVFRLVYLFALIPSLLSFFKKTMFLTKINRIILVFFAVLGLYFNSKYIYSAIEIMCENKICQFGEQTLLSKTKLPIFDKFLLPKYPTQDMLTTKRPWF